MINTEKNYHEFLKFYSGHSQYIPATKGDYNPVKKKLEYIYKKRRLTLDIDAVVKHIQYGTPHIVVNPINEITGLCKFGAIDVDDYDKQGPEYYEKIKQKVYSLKLPLHIVDSVSGGLHLYFYVDTPIDPKLMIAVLQHYRIKLGLPEDTEIFPKQDELTEKNPFGNNIKLPCAGVRETGLKNHLKICTKLVQKKEEIEKLPLDLSTVAPKKTITKFTAKEIRQNIKDRKTHPRGGEYDNWITDLTAKYVYAGMTDKQMLYQFNLLKEYSDKSKEANYFENKIANARKKFKTEDPEFLRDLFIRNIIYIRRNCNFYNLALNDAYKKDAIDTEYKNIMPPNQRGVRPKPSEWFSLHPKKTIVEDYMYRPSQYDEENKIITYNGKKYLNSYQPNNIEPVEGDITMFNELMELLFPEDEIREKVLDWYCHIIQNRGDKIRYAILLFSPEQQLGKGSLFSLMRKILGKNNTAEIDVGEALDKSKSFLDNQLVLIDELKSDEKWNTNKKLVNMLKRLITEESHGARELYTDYKEKISTVNIVLHSNEEDALAIGQNDPRYFVIGCYSSPKPEEWYSKLWDFIGRGDDVGDGVSRVLYFLKNRKIRKSFNAKGRAPVTEFSKKMANSGEHPLTQRVREDFDSKSDLFENDVISTSDFRIYYEYQKRIKIHRPNDISNALKSIGGIKFGQVECKVGTVKNPTLWIIRNHDRYKSWDKAGMVKHGWKPIYYLDTEQKVKKYWYQNDGTAPEHLSTTIFPAKEPF